MKQHRDPKRLIAKTIALAGLFGLTSPVFAVDLIDVYEQSLQSDPIFQAAISTRLSNREALPQSVAQLLPTVSATGNTAGNYLHVLKNTSAGTATDVGAAAAEGVNKYNAHGYTLNLTQPLFNFGSWMQVREASATAKQADATYAAAVQDLFIRVAQAYFAVLEAQDTLQYTHASKVAYQNQLYQEQERYKVGLDAITSLYEAQASYDAAVSQEIGAQNALVNAQEDLRKLTGQAYEPLEGLKVELPLINPQPTDAEQWVAAAVKNNMTLQASNYAVQAARAKIKVNYAGHFPTLNAVGAYGQNYGANNGVIDNKSGSVSLQLSMPVFQGGLVASETRQAQDDYATASANREDTYRTTVVATRQKYNDIMSGISKVKADREAIVSAQASLDSTEESYKVGTRTIVDVLLAQQTLYQAKTTYAQDEYKYLVDTLLLKQDAGIIRLVDLQQINSWLHSTTSK